MSVPSTPSTDFPDTFIDTHKVTKGIAFLNAQPLGRFWSVGPQFTLYAPGSWLKQGSNEVVVFDLQGKASEALTTVEHADYGLSHSR
jgi:beta-galactosidase